MRSVTASVDAICRASASLCDRGHDRDRADQRDQQQRAGHLDGDQVPAEQLPAERGDVLGGQNPPALGMQADGSLVPTTSSKSSGSLAPAPARSTSAT